MSTQTLGVRGQEEEPTTAVPKAQEGLREKSGITEL
jgi:hypothetical protein